MVKKFIKQFLPRSLFARSLLILMLPIVLTMIISIYIFFDRHWERTAARLAVGVAGEVSYLVGQVERNKEEEFLKNLMEDSMSSFQLSFKYVDGSKIQAEPDIYVGRSHIIRSILSHELEKRIDHPYRIIVDVEEKWTQVQVQLSEGALIVTSPQSRLFSSSGYVFLMWMVGISSVLLTVAILFMRNQIRPIKRLAVAAERFGKGRDVPFFKPEGAREVRQAAKSFIDMRARIDRQIQQRTAMLAGVSHDLRTPLTRMKLQAEMLPEGKDREAFKSDLTDMERMINAYLQFAKGDGNEPMQRTDVLALLNWQAESFGRSDFQVKISVPENVNFEIFLRPVAFDRCIGNIISNAQKYAKAVWIYLKRQGDQVEIIVDDDGSGIEEAHYKDVFKPFYREEKSRNSKTGGVGLGLPIAQDVIIAHGGDITLDKSPKGGLRVIIHLPV